MDREAPVFVVDHVIDELAEFFIFHGCCGAVERLPPGTGQKGGGHVAILIDAVVILLGVVLNQLIKGILVFSRIKLEHHVILGGIADIAVFRHLNHGVGRGRFAGLAPVDHVLVGRDLRLELDIGIQILALKEPDQLLGVLIVAVSVLDRVIRQEMRIIRGILEVVAGRGTLKHNLISKVRELLLFKIDEAVHGTPDDGENVIVRDASEIMAALAGDLRAAVQEVRHVLGSLGTYQLKVQCARKIRRIFICHIDIVALKNVLSLLKLFFHLVRRGLIRVRKRQLLKPGNAKPLGDKGVLINVAVLCQLQRLAAEGRQDLIRRLAGIFRFDVVILAEIFCRLVIFGGTCRRRSESHGKSCGSKKGHFFHCHPP